MLLHNNLHKEYLIKTYIQEFFSIILLFDSSLDAYLDCTRRKCIWLRKFLQKRYPSSCINFIACYMDPMFGAIVCCVLFVLAEVPFCRLGIKKVFLELLQYGYKHVRRHVFKGGLIAIKDVKNKGHSSRVVR